jgi:hypothetical protein
MAMIAPPEGMSEVDYESIEAAVMETVRGRWFLAEYARRSRVDEMHQMLDAIGKLEQVVREQQAQPADPSIRLLVQRLKDVSQSLERMVGEMRARAVSGLLRLNTSSPAAELHRPRALPEATPQPAQSLQHSAPAHADRRAALARLDQLPIAEKLALFG